MKDRQRRVLIVTYYFPPSGGSGVQRVLKLTRYLPDFGWLPTVLTVDPQHAAYPEVDAAMAAEVPAEVRVERTRAWDPYGMYARLLGKEKAETVGVGFVGEAETNRKQRLARWLRANIFLPDARVGWVPFVLRRGARLLRSGGYDAILSTGPPHSAHLAARRLARRFGVPWVADFRDPWTEIDFYADLPMTAVARSIDARMERAVLRAADRVVTVSRSCGLALQKPGLEAPVVIENGFDPADFAGAGVVPAEGFVIAHVGNMPASRDPAGLWGALAALDAGTSMPGLRVVLVGNVDPVIVRHTREAGLGDVVTAEPYVAHHEAVRTMRQATLLLLSINQVRGAEGITTGKLYEYVASGRPVLGLGPPQGDAASVLKRTGAGRMFDHDDATGIAGYLKACYDAWKKGDALTGASREAAAPYSRRTQAQAMADVLDRVKRKA